VCVCPGRSGYPSYGLTSGAWLPTRIAETTRKAWCMPAIGADMGADMESDSLKLEQGGYKTNADAHNGSSFRNFHYYYFPADIVLDMIADSACSSSGGGGDMDVLYFSELDPTWNDDEMSLYTTPEAVLFTNPIGVASCAADAIASSAMKPILAMTWCAGSQGLIYPYTGATQFHTSAVREASLASIRGVAMMHRRNLMKKTYGLGAICQDAKAMMMPKQQYRPQVMFPVPETKGNNWMGAETMTALTEPRHVPVTGEDWDMLMWQYAECCVTAW
jgi:conjugal transfer pilus assembly protein TraU